MSIYSFRNALIGLAREYKRISKRFSKRGKAAPAYGAEVAQVMADSGYFPEDASKVFGDALEYILQASTPARKNPKEN